MAPAAAPCQSLHELAGMCEYCGEACDSTTDELNAINCTFEGCPSPEIYHQSCIEAYLKSIRLDKQRKTGFQCPRGCGKGSKWDKPCPGRVTKSHPIHARNDSSKKRRKAKQPEPAPQLPSPASAKKQAGLTKSKSVKSDKEKSPEVESEDSRVCPTPVKAQVLNRASTFPGGDKSSALSNSNGHGEAGAAAADMKDGDGPFSGSKIGGSYMEKSSDSGSADTSDSEDSSNASQMSTSAPSRDFKEVLAGPRYIPAPPVVNAWASGRPRNGDIPLPPGKDQIQAVPPEVRPTSAQPANQSEPTNVKQVVPVSAEEASLLAEIDKQEERRKRAQGKNEKKHVRQVLAKLRERLDDLRKSRATLSATAAHISDEIRNSTASSDAVGKSMAAKLTYSDGQGTLGKWSPLCINALRNRKAAAIVKHLKTVGFDDVQCNIAIQAAGISVQNCLEWLLRNATSIQANKPDLLPQGPPVEISVELKQLDELLKSKDFTQDQIEVAVVNECGDIEAAMEQLKRGRSQRNGVASGPTRSATPAAQGSPTASSSNGMPRGANPGNTGSIWDGSRRTTATGSSVRPSQSEDPEFEDSRNFAGGECISNVSMYNARVGVEEQRASPREVMSSLTSTRTSLSREGGRPPFALPSKPQVPGSVEQYVNTMESSVATSSYSRLPVSTPEVPIFSKPSMELVSNAFVPHVNSSSGPSRALPGAGFFHPQSEHGQAMENGYSSFLSEPTASTVTSVTAAVLNDGEYDEQAIKESMARIPESQDLTESSIWNPRHESEIWGTQGLGAAGPSSSFYNSDTARRITTSAPALSEAFSNGAALGSDPSYGLNGRNGFTGGNWNSRLGLTQSFRNMRPAPGFGGASAQAQAPSVGIPDSDYSFEETEGWMHECFPLRPRNGYTRPAGLYDQSLAYGDQQRHRQNGLNGVLSQAVSGASHGRAVTVGTSPGIWERHPLRAPVEEQDSLVNHLVGLLKGVEV